MKPPRLFSIPPGAAFLPVFVHALREGRLVSGYDGCDPLMLANTTIYVPTRRAARTLRSTLVETSPVAASFLPRICPLGDIDDDLLVFTGDIADAGIAMQPVAPTDRLLLLARLIRPWRESLPAHIRSLFGHEAILIPASTADAIWLARDLARLMDEMETEDADWARLHEIAPDIVAEWWQVTIDFLDIVTTSWPHVLAERGGVNPADFRNRALRRQVVRLMQNPPDGPVIVAGATGSLPATAELIKAIACMPRGAVVLPGLDRDLDETSWQSLDGSGAEPSVFGHPQYSLNKLLRFVGVSRSAVEYLGNVPPVCRRREMLVAQAFRPAATTDAWSRLDRSHAAEAFRNVTLIEAAGEREEALAIAVALRNAIEEPDKTAALVTGNRNLARRVAAELMRFGIHADDSGGAPLSETEPAALVRLLLSCIFEPGDPVALLSLLKHPLVQIGQERAVFRKCVERFELFGLRGGTGRIALGAANRFIAERLQKLTDRENHQSASFGQAIVHEMVWLGELLTQAAAPLYDFANLTRLVSVAEAVAATVAAFENFGRNTDGALNALYAHEAGQSLMQFLRALVADRSELDFMPSEWPEIFAALIAGETVRLHPRGHPRLMIWGALEARLQTVDTIVIGGLNEGVSPASARNDPYLSRTMKTTIVLEPPERLIGLAAHDFQMALGMEHVILSRALRLDNAPSVPSRWLQRLETVLGPDTTAEMRARGTVLLHWAEQLDVAPDVPFIARPCPIPPLELRPRRFSVTEIETLRRDPYAIYAKKILRLKPLEPLVCDPSAAERGTLYHAIVAAFAENGGNLHAPDAYERLMQIARAEFDRLQLPPDVEAVWWPRFAILAPELLQWEQGLGPRRRFAEVAARPIPVNKTGIELSGRADRIDIFDNKYADIVDFKTGSTPSAKQAATLMAPQLALEGALLARGAFPDCGAYTPANLLYIRLKADGAVEPQSILKTAGKGAAELAEEAWVRLQELVSHYQKPGQGYLSRALPPMVDYEGDYDHLARVWEWSAGTAGEEE